MKGRNNGGRISLAEAEKGIEDMLNAIQMGIITTSTKQRLADLEEQKAQLEQQILVEQIKNPALSRVVKDILS